MDYYGNYSEVSSELYHHGILGQKWGVRRYQNYDGSLTGAGRKRYGSSSSMNFLERRRRRKAIALAAKKRKATLEAKKKAEEEARTHEEAKQKAISSGTAKDIVKFQNELSNQELRDALDRLNSKQRLSDLVDKETPKKKTSFERASEIADKAAKAADLAEKGVKVYNTYAKIHNSFADGKSQLPIIGEKKDKQRDPVKDKVIRSGDPKELAKWRGKLSTEELKEAQLNVMNWERINALMKTPVAQAGGASVSSKGTSDSSKGTSDSETSTPKKTDWNARVREIEQASRNAVQRKEAQIVQENAERRMADVERKVAAILDTEKTRSDARSLAEKRTREYEKEQKAREQLQETLNEWKRWNKRADERRGKNK